MKTVIYAFLSIFTGVLILTSCNNNYNVIGNQATPLHQKTNDNKTE